MSCSYDNRGRITSIDAAGMLQRRMSWSPEGTITAIADGTSHWQASLLAMTLQIV